MRKFLCLCLYLIPCFGAFAQTKGIDLDSLPHKYKNTLDSNLSKLKEDSKVKVSSSFKTPKIDSSFLESKKKAVQASLVQKAKLPSISNNLKSKFSKYNIPNIKKDKKVFVFSGEVRSENYASNIQNPLMRNEPIYSRLYIAPSITLLGLPFKANFFLTTENNNTYKSNFFSFKLDVNALRQSAANEIQNQLDEYKKLDVNRIRDLQVNSIDLQNSNFELNRLKSKIPSFDSLNNVIKSKLEEAIRLEIENAQEEMKKKLLNASEEEKQRLELEFKQYKDSLLLESQNNSSDSLLKYASQNGVDSGLLNQYFKAEKEFSALKEKQKEIEKLRQSDSAKLLTKISSIRNPDDLRELSKGHLGSNGFLQSALSIERFGIGVVNPQYSEFTLYSASIKGLDIGVNRKKFFYDVTLGKTTKQFLGSFSNNIAIYDRNIFMSRFGLGELKKNFLALEYLYGFDPQSTNLYIPLLRNQVLNLNAKYTFLEKTLFESSVAQSFYKETNGIPTTTNFVNPNRVYSESSNRAYLLKTTHILNKFSKVEIQMKQVGIGFKSIGNPFLRKNYREIESKFETQFFKQKLKVTASYKEMRDNLVAVSEAINRIKGYGLKISTSFDKYPNLTLSYSPYQQGNNNPDSLYRTNNQFSLTNAIVSYKRKIKTCNWISLFSYTNSSIEIGNNNKVRNQMLNLVNTIQIGKKHTSVINAMKSITAPFVDSLNSTSFQVTHSYMANKMGISALFEHTSFKNGALKIGGGLQLNTNIFKKIGISVVAKYDRIHKLWNYENSNVFTGKMVLVWRW